MRNSFMKITSPFESILNKFLTVPKSGVSTWFFDAIELKGFIYVADSGLDLLLAYSSHRYEQLLQ